MQQKQQKSVNMISSIIQLLQKSDYYGVSEMVEIAKGKYEIPDTIKKGKEQVIRYWKNNTKK